MNVTYGIPGLLEPVTLDIGSKRGSLTIICGINGTGKTRLLQALYQEWKSVQDNVAFFPPHKRLFTDACQAGELKGILWNGVLILDEPETGQHPENQRKMARRLSQFVNHSANVVVVTHSDYMIKEWNILIQLHSDLPHIQELRRMHFYAESTLLDPKRVKAYNIEFVPVGQRKKDAPYRLTEAEVDPEVGIFITSFDQANDTMNGLSRAALFGIRNPTCEEVVVRAFRGDVSGLSNSFGTNGEVR
jgi:hypothetical protein